EKIFGAIRIDDFVEAWLDEGAGHLACAVGAEIVEDHGVVIVDRTHWHSRLPVPHPLGDDNRLDKFVRPPALVACAKRSYGTRILVERVAMHHRAVCQLDAFPTV